jgi:hypothetical protein
MGEKLTSCRNKRRIPLCSRIHKLHRPVLQCREGALSKLLKAPDIILAVATRNFHSGNWCLQNTIPLAADSLLELLRWQIPQDMRHSNLRQALLLSIARPLDLDAGYKFLILCENEDEGHVWRCRGQPFCEEASLDLRNRSVLLARYAIPDAVNAVLQWCGESGPRS